MTGFYHHVDPNCSIKIMFGWPRRKRVICSVHLAHLWVWCLANTFSYVFALLIYINKILRAKSGLFQTPPRKMHRSWQVGSQMKACNLPEFTSCQKFAKNSTCAHKQAVLVAKLAKNWEMSNFIEMSFFCQMATIRDKNWTERQLEKKFFLQKALKRSLSGQQAKWGTTDLADVKRLTTWYWTSAAIMVTFDFYCKAMGPLFWAGNLLVLNIIRMKGKNGFLRRS